MRAIEIPTRKTRNLEKTSQQALSAEQLQQQQQQQPSDELSATVNKLHVQVAALTAKIEAANKELEKISQGAPTGNEAATATEAAAPPPTRTPVAAGAPLSGEVVASNPYSRLMVSLLREEEGTLNDEQ